MIYFDNAATTYPKPPEVIKTMSRATVRYGANPGRGGHKISYLTSEAVYETRKRVAEFFGTDAPENVIFTKNCTEALNIVIKGLCVPGCRFICSSLDHNAVIRPLEALRRNGTADYDIAPVGKFTFDIPCAGVLGVMAAYQYKGCNLYRRFKRFRRETPYGKARKACP